MSTTGVSEIFDPDRWEPVEGFDLSDVTYHRGRTSADRGRSATPSGRRLSTSSTARSTTPAWPLMSARSC